VRYTESGDKFSEPRAMAYKEIHDYNGSL
jgi:hypothetical protein